MENKSTEAAAEILESNAVGTIMAGSECGGSDLAASLLSAHTERTCGSCGGDCLTDCY